MDVVQTRISEAKASAVLRRKHLNITDSRKKILSLFLNHKDGYTLITVNKATKHENADEKDEIKCRLFKVDGKYFNGLDDILVSAENYKDVSVQFNDPYKKYETEHPHFDGVYVLANSKTEGNYIR